MNNEEAIVARHSVRAYTDEPIGQTDRQALQEEIDACNAEGNLHISLVCDEPQAFDSTLAHYGKFSNVRNYLVLAGKPAPDLDERCGYHGERIVLLAQRLGLNTCWVGLTFKKRFVKKALAPGEKLVIVIAIGHGETDGQARPSKFPADVSEPAQDAPAWFSNGVEAALLAPTAMNQQRFRFTLRSEEGDDAPVVDATAKAGAYTLVDLGIAKLHFEIGAGPERFTWV